MALSIRFLRQLFLVPAVFLTAAGISFSTVVAQDPGSSTGPITAGTTTFQNAPVNNILDLYETLTGLHLVRDANLTGLPPVSLNVSGLGKADTITIIKQYLLLNGVAIVPIDEHTANVVTVGTNKQPRSEGVRLYANAADLPGDGEIVTYYMPLNYINPQEAVGIFSQVAPAHTYGVYVPAPSAQAAIITESSTVIRQLIALKNLIDAPPAHVVGEWVQINRADADKVADLLNKMLGQASTSTAAGGAPAAAPQIGNPNGVNVPAGLGNESPLSNEKNLISGPAQIIADTIHNRIWISTRPVNIPFLEQLIGQLDSADTYQAPQRRALKYVLAQDILPALEAVLAQGKDEEDQVKKDAQAAQTNGQANGQNRNGTSTTTAQSAASSGGAGGAGGGGGVAPVTPQLSAPNENNVPTVVTIGKTRLLADNRANAIIVFGTSEVTSRVFYMIDQLDRKPLQVYLASVIGQLTVSEGFEFGIDILQKFSGNRTGVSTSNLNSSQATGSGGAGFLPEPSALNAAKFFPLASGLTLYGAIGNTLNAYLRALETTDRFKIISRPSIYTTNNQLAVIASGSEVPVPQSTVSGFSTGTDLTTQSTIAYEDVLLQLDIIPLINANHEVTLKIRQTNNSLGKNQSISGNLIPIINTQEINTEVTVPNRGTVVIGGLITDTTTRDTSGIPWLSDIPILGYLFKDTTKSKERDELIIMIQPSVVETDADQLEINEEEKERTILGREAVEATQVPQPISGTTTTTTTISPSPMLEPVTGIRPAVIDNKEVTTTHTANGGGAYNSKTGHAATTTTSTSVTTQKTIVVPGTTSTTSGTSSIVPALSSPAPDVGKARLPSVNPPVPTAPPPSQTP